MNLFHYSDQASFSVRVNRTKPAMHEDDDDQSSDESSQSSEPSPPPKKKSKKKSMKTSE